MTQETPNVRTSAALQLALWTLFAGNFIIGTGILLPAGMLNDLSQGLGVSPAAIGLLMLAGGIVIGSRVGKIDIRTISLAVAVTCSALALILMAFWRLKRR